MKHARKALNESQRSVTSRTKATLTRNQSCGSYSNKKQVRPASGLPSLSQKRIFKRYQIKGDNKLDVMNLIIENNPNDFDTNAVKNKIEEMSRNNKQSASKTSQLFFRYNVLYGSKSSNLIKTYSPKLRPQSASVSLYVKKIHLNGKELNVFNDEQIQLLFEAKCRDLNVAAKPELEKRFRDFVKAKCINRIIDLSECNIGYNCVEVLKSLLTEDNCSRLVLQHNSIGDRGIEQLIPAIANNKSLVYLDISSNDIYFRGGVLLFDSLIHHPSIISLNLASVEGVNRNRLTAEGVKPLERVLKENHFLEILSLSGNSIKNEGMRSIIIGLENNTSLKELDLSKNEIDEKAFEYLPSLTLTKLTDLNLSHNPIKNEGLAYLAAAMISPAMNNIRNLSLSNCKLTIEGIKQFFQVISQNTTLQKINLSHNLFSKSGVKSLETSLSTMNIRDLSLSSCSIGKQAVDIAELLKVITTIKSIDLSNNQIDDSTFLHFASLPINNSSIETMDFSRNHLTGASGKIFFLNLQNSSSLKKVNFYDNQFENSLANVILSCLRLNRNIIYLNINSNQIQLKIVKEIQMQVNSNIKLSKKKFVPYLKAIIKALDFKPNEFDALKGKIRYAKKDQAIFIEKIEEDIEKFAQMKREEQKKMKRQETERKKQEEELTRIKNELKKVNCCKEEGNDFQRKNVERISGVIQGINREIAEIEKGKGAYMAERDIYLNDLRMNKVKTDIEVKKTFDKASLAQLMLKMTKDELNGKLLLLDKLVNPQKYESIKDDVKENGPKRKGQSSKRESSKTAKDKGSRREENADEKEENKSLKKIEGKRKANKKEVNAFKVNTSMKESKRNKMVLMRSQSTGSIVLKKDSVNEKKANENGNKDL